MEIKDKVFVVTGGGSGIGKELVIQLLEKGAKVAAVDLRLESLDELKEYLGDKADKLATFALDISDKKAVEKLTDEVVRKFGEVDGLINNAGIIQPFVKVNDLDYEVIEKVMNVNFYGTLYMVKAFLPELLKRPEANITNVSSMGGFLPVPGQSIYGASKAAVKLMTEGLYAELKDTNVSVTTVFPGATATNITKNSAVEAPKISKDVEKKFPALSANEAAKQILGAIICNQPQVCTGNDSKFMNLLYRFNPVYATNLIAKQMKSLLK